MKFLVTGGAGFIGSNFLHFMTKRYPKDSFACLDALTYAGNMETLGPVMRLTNFKFIMGDIRDRAFVYKLFEKERFDIVINFAAESHVDRSIENPQVFFETNIIGASVLLDACQKYGIKRLHQVSTDEVYGDLPLNSSYCFHEQDPVKGSSPYAVSKSAADLLVLAYHRTYGLKVTISRASDTYGPYQFPEKLIPLMIQKARKGEKLPVYGDGKNVRDWLHVSDHCNAIDLIVRKGRDGEIYNVGGHNERSNLQVVKTILKALGKDDSLIENVKDRLGHDRRYAICPDKIESELGWMPEYDFDTGIAETILWNIDNQEWLNHVESGEYKKWMERYKKL